MLNIKYDQMTIPSSKLLFLLTIKTVKIIKEIKLISAGYNIK